MSAPSVVELSAPLPRAGLHLIEASAGTGKTYTLETLVARYVAETDLPIARLLLVTFTNDAAAELRQRVRRRLHVLARLVERGTLAADANATERHILGLPSQPLVGQRLQAAVRDFDQATITTIHAFAQQLLAQSGLDHSPTVRLRTDIGTVAVDVVADELARRSLELADSDLDGTVPGLSPVLNGLKLVRNRPGIPVLPQQGEQQRLLAVNQLLQRWEQHPAPDAAEIASFPTGPFSPRSEKQLVKVRDWLEKGLALAEAVRTSNRRLSDELLRRNEIGFTELLTEANELIQRSPRAAEEIRSRYRLVLVDEFQDTDPVQWSLLSTLFTAAGRAEQQAAAGFAANTPAVSPVPVPAPGSSPEPLRLFALEDLDTDAADAADTHGNSYEPASGPQSGVAAVGEPSHLPEPTTDPHITVLVGDPKQAIYGFRGGDIDTYRKAGQQAGTNRSTLQRNYRSEGNLIDGLNAIFTDVDFGPDVPYVPVEADRDPLSGDGPAIQVRTWPAAEAGSAEQRRSMIAADLAETVVGLAADPKTDLSYGKIAVLYTSHLNGPPILRALQDRGVPAVITRGETVFNTPAVSWWRRLLWALERPTDPARARNALVAPIIGRHPDDLADDELVRRAQGDLRELATVLETSGVAAALRRLLRDWSAAARLLEHPGGERNLVDIEHVGELLHLETRGQPVSATAVREVLEELELADPDDANFAAELTRRRLDTEADDNVVRIMSIHTAKGLEFEAVLCPNLFETPRLSSPVHYHLDDREAKELGVASGSSALRFTYSGLDKAAWTLANQELIAERKRLSYVALTRARDRLVIWWPDGQAKFGKTTGSGLHELLISRGDSLGVVHGDDPIHVFRELAEQAPSCIGVATVASLSPESRIDLLEAPATRDASSGGAVVAASRFTRVMDRSASRLSFTGITRVAFPYEDRHGAQDPSPDPDLSDDAGSLDENPDEILDEPLELNDAEVLLAALPAGREPGTRLHSIYELADFGGDASDRDRQVTELVADAFPDLDLDLQERVVDGVLQTFDASLGASVDGLRLADIARADRLDELHFDLPLRTRADHAGTLVALGDLVSAHIEQDSGHQLEHRELLGSWAEELRSPKRVVRLGGFLTGSIDLLFRHGPKNSPDQRYVVSDYKSNKVARWPQPMTPEIYTQEHLAVEMLEGQYLLQAFLYLLATHRFLQARLGSYDPDVHLGPAVYLFVRGLTGAADEHNQPHGVFSWRPSTALLLDAEALLLAPRPEAAS